MESPAIEHPPVAVWRARDRAAICVGRIGRHPDDNRPVLICDGRFYQVTDLVPGSFIGVYWFSEITQEDMNLLVEMQQMGYALLAADTRTQPQWTPIEIPRFRVVGE
jgi:hypothetical protein